MPATRSQIRRPKVVTHTVDFGDGVTVACTFDANKITDAWMDEWTSQEQQSNVSKLNDMLADLIDAWDLLEEENGPVIPITAEEIGALFSLPRKVDLLRQLGTAELPTSAEGNGSSDTSSTQATASMPPQVNPQNGPATSSSPAPSASPSPT